MDLFRIDSTKHTPGVILDPVNGSFEFYGFSLPEDAAHFYQPINQWLLDYFQVMVKTSTIKKEINVLFKLVYFNSSSLRFIVDIFHVFNKMIESGIVINISWHYDNEDPQMAETGRELGLVAKIPVNVVPVY